MEAVDREAMCLAIYTELIKSKSSMGAAELASLLNNTCEGYSFPTNLDTDPPLEGMAPQTQKQLITQALTEGWSKEKFSVALQNHTLKRRG